MFDILLGIALKLCIVCFVLFVVLLFRFWQQYILVNRFWVMLSVDIAILSLITEALIYFSFPLEEFSEPVISTPRHLISFSLMVTLTVFLFIFGVEARVMRRRYTVIKDAILIAAIAGTLFYFQEGDLNNSDLWSTLYIPLLVFIGIVFFPNISQAGKLPELDKEFKHNFVNVNGIRTHYIVKGEGYPIVLVHGLPETFYSWHKIIEPLAKHFKVYALDTLGYGFTDKPAQGYTIQDLANHVTGFMDALNLRRPVLVGHDWGGYVAWEIGVFSPEKISRLVVINATLYRNKHAVHHRFFRIPGIYEFIGAFLSNLFFEKVYTSRSAANLDKFNLKEYIHMRNLFNIRGTYHSSAQIFHSLGSQKKHIKKRKKIGVNVPTLYIWAEKDPRQPKDVFTEEVQPYVHDLTLKTAPNSGHFLQSEQPHVLVEYLVNYLKEERPVKMSTT